MDVSLESKALTLLENYEGANNYLLELQRKSQINKKFYPTRSQSEYIINNHDKQPKVAKKWVVLDAYFAQKLADDKLYTEIPQKIWVEKLLADKEKAFHIWGKVFEYHNPYKTAFNGVVKKDLWSNAWLYWLRNHDEFEGFNDDAFRFTMRYLFNIWGVHDIDNLGFPIEENKWFTNHFFPNQLNVVIHPTSEDSCVAVYIYQNKKEIFSGWVMDDSENNIYNNKYNEEVENTCGVFSDNRLGLHLIQFMY